MPNERTVQVVNPNGIPWSVRFISDEAAWSRLIALKTMHAKKPVTQATLEAEGWTVKNTDAG